MSTSYFHDEHQPTGVPSEYLTLADPSPGQVRIDPRPGDGRRATIIGRPDGARVGRGGWDYQWIDRHGRAGRCWASDESLLMEFSVAVAALDMGWVRQFLADTLNPDFLSQYQREITGDVPESVLQWADVPFDWADE